ncbi:hypothetical protein AMELA_G00238810 [Ameiurus melas]|uniref:Uncharacterized protein n=1 Tax=Ameiurus melas TaxID=219545 RepID=A0A7J5ZUR3_AMEME|nr:hypothetical protein AMELA_G00238810 [Ameiurus melas]
MNVGFIIVALPVKEVLVSGDRGRKMSPATRQTACTVCSTAIRSTGAAEHYAWSKHHWLTTRRSCFAEHDPLLSQAVVEHTSQWREGKRAAFDHPVT